MKFGRNLPRNQVPEWASSYINYKSLKKLIKAGAEAAKRGQEPDLAEFFFALDRNLEDVGGFYNKKLAEFTRRLNLLEERYGSLPTVHSLDAEEREDLIAVLLELRGQFRKLQWYGDVNRRGFVKITKKLDKRIPSADAQKRYLAAKVDPAPFASNLELSEALKRINDGLSVLGDLDIQKDASSSKSSLSLRRVGSRPTLNIPQQDLQNLEQLIREDNVEELTASLENLFQNVSDADNAVRQHLLRTLLQRAIHNKSRACIDAILGRLPTLEDDDDINNRNCIHRLVISIGRTQTTSDLEQNQDYSVDAPTDFPQFLTPAAAPTVPAKQRPFTKASSCSQLLNREDPSVSILAYLLDSLRSSQRPDSLARDSAGRTPLHYAAQYGFRVVCQVLIEHIQQWDMLNLEEGIDGPEWQDNEGWAPLHLSVVGGHPLTTQNLLEAERKFAPDNRSKSIRKSVVRSSAVLALATKANFVDIVSLLVGAGVDINYQDAHGESALHVAARFGHVECAKVLLEGSETQKADTELCEQTYSWTPLFVACVDGSFGIVDLLVEAGADLCRIDSSGWTCKEHASLRGHIDIANRLAEVTPQPENESDVSTAASTSPPSSSLINRKSNSSISSNFTPNVRTPEPVKSFGHRYLTDESMVLVSLGTMDTRKSVSAVSLDRIPMKSVHTTQLDTALSIVISAVGAKGEPEMVDLPVQDNISTEPVVFFSRDTTKVKILFDLVPTYAGSREKILGRGAALLSSVKQSIGSKRINLQGDLTVPIMAVDTMDVIGSVTFNFLIVTPFAHPNMSITANQTYWKSMSSTMVIGHRGLGKNIAGRSSLQLGENTIQSFIAAANLGAEYVEFDVQLTKDHVPVIYHDFLVSETGIDAPVHTLTLEQFLHVNDSRTFRESRPTSPDALQNLNVKDLASSETRRQRSMSLGGSGYDPYPMDEKMKHTRDFKKKGFKGNSRGSHIQEPFATLEEMFKKLPKSTGFNIEMKYPMLFESEDEGMDTYAVELNSFVDTVLKIVYDLGGGRDMIFSSFNPDMCLLLSFKQPSIPVLFLTDAGTSPVGDIRASSLQEGIRFATRWNLLGIVSAAEPLVISPRLVKVVKESGLVCVSYGTINNDPLNVDLQRSQGIDAVIVDSVLKIRKGLTASERKSTESDSLPLSAETEIEDKPDGHAQLDSPSIVNITEIAAES
ncbi:MAG: hypothetical protein Q9227_005253 [Pyrenula ochraceoflavens]